MNTLRHYFISNSLDDLEVFEEQLEAAGIATPQIHVLSRNDAEVENHRHLHEVQSFMKKDIVHSTERGAVVGLCAFVLVLSVAYFAGWTETAVGWMPFIFLAVVLLGFSTWVGGLLGIEKPNHKFARFEQDGQPDQQPQPQRGAHHRRQQRPRAQWRDRRPARADEKRHGPPHAR